MPLTSAYLLPHPPIILPEVGRGEETKIAATNAAYNKAAKSIAAQSPRTIVVISPHARAFKDFTELAGCARISGDMRKFRAAGVEVSEPVDTEFTWALCAAATEQNLPVGVLSPNDITDLDHGSLIPLYYVNKYYRGYKVVLAGISGLPPSLHFRFGEIIAQTAKKFDGNTVLIASGDLSHCLLAEGPYGFHPDGPVFDQTVVKTINDNNLGAFLNLDETFTKNAAQCGLIPLIVMTGAIGKTPAEARVLSYEGPFGVGYGVAEVKLKKSEV